MTELVSETVDTRYTNACGKNIKPVLKSRLRQYIGTMTPEFMDKIQKIIDIAYELKREPVVVKEEKEDVEKPILQETIVTQPPQKQDVSYHLEQKPVVQKETEHVNKSIPKKITVAPQVIKKIEEDNVIRKQLLGYVDNNELQKILESDWPNHIKAQKLLELYSFDLNRNGVMYLLKAINISLKQSYFNLETLSESVSKKVGVDKAEVMRLIVARVKERFSFKKAPTIDFIRLINSLLLKQEGKK